MPINLTVPQDNLSLRPKISVVGVGGAGGNAVANMIRAKLEGVDFIVANTDAQSLTQSLCQRRIHLGAGLTKGLGAGARPDIGRAAAEEAMREISEQLTGSNMCFITAGMGGGTGTGAAPVVAQLAREQGILTVGVVTKPFHFEGTHRMRMAEAGIQELNQYVDTLIVIPNQNLFRIANEKTTFADAFRLADEVLHMGVRGVTDLMTMPGLINLDFADVQTIMSGMGKAMMGTGEATGENRATLAAEAAISNPLLDEVSMKGARGVLINITGGPDLTLFEVDEAANRIRDEVDPEANIIFGSTTDANLEGKVRISVVATGIDQAAQRQANGAQLSLVSHNPKPQGIAVPAMERQAMDMSSLAAASIERNAAIASAVAAPAAIAATRMEMPASMPTSLGATALAMPQGAMPVAAQPAPAMKVEARLAEQLVPPMAMPAVAAPEMRAMPAPAPLPQAEKKMNIFRRMTGKLAGHAQPAGAMNPQASSVKAEPAFGTSKSASASVQNPSSEMAKRMEQPVQPQLAFEANERITMVRAEEEMLDIPAFLRRQAN